MRKMKKVELKEEVRPIGPDVTVYDGDDSGGRTPDAVEAVAVKDSRSSRKDDSDRDIKAQYKHTKVGQMLFDMCARWTKFVLKHRWLYYVLAFTWGAIMT